MLRTSARTGAAARWLCSPLLLHRHSASGHQLGLQGTRASAIDVMAREHENVQVLLEKALFHIVPPKENGPQLDPPPYSATQPSDLSAEEKRELLQELLREITIHKVLEDTYVRPIVQAVFRDGPAIVDEWTHKDSGLMERVKSLHRLTENLPRNLKEWPNFPVDEVEALKDCCLEHAQELNDRIFPELRRTLTEEKLIELGHSLEVTRRNGAAGKAGHSSGQCRNYRRPYRREGEHHSHK